MNFLKSNPDFLIIGGGIFGCSIAWNLSRRSSGSVLLLERLELTSATTPRPAGLIRNLSPSRGQTALKTHTLKTIELLSEELEEPLHWHQVGGLLVAESEANISHLEALEKLSFKPFGNLNGLKELKQRKWFRGWMLQKQISLLCFRMMVS